MASLGTRADKAPESDWSAADLRLSEAFQEMLAAERGASPNTRESYFRDPGDCARFLKGRGADLSRAGSEDLRAYMAALAAAGRVGDLARQLGAPVYIPAVSYLLGKAEFAAGETEAAMRAVGFQDVSTVDRNAWYAPLTKHEVSQLEGPLRERIIEVSDEATYAHWINVRRTLRDSVLEGALRPTHLRGFKAPG